MWLWIVMGVWASFMAARGANVIREARKTIKEARYEENGDAAKKVAERLNAAEKSLLEAIPAEKKHGAFSSLSRLLCLSLISDFLFPGRSSRTTNPEIRIQKQILMQSPMPSSSSSSPAALFLRPFLRLCGTAAAEECARYRAAAAALRHASISFSAVARSKGLERGSVSYPPRP